MLENKSNLFGFYRALVVQNKDPEFFGRVLVWIPDLMPKVEKSKGIWALPANNPISGLNNDGDSQHYYSGTSFVLPKGSYCWVFFENGNPNRPYYFSGLNIQNTKILPECQVGNNPEKKWVIFKSNEGRTIIISDDESDSRVEITGKKRELSNPPSGDVDSVYLVDGNQTVILLDERDEQEKILVRTYMGDFINLDIKNRTLNISVSSNIEIKTGADLNIESGGNINLKSGSKINIQSNSNVNILSASNVNIDGVVLNEQLGLAESAESANPEGER